MDTNSVARQSKGLAVRNVSPGARIQSREHRWLADDPATYLPNVQRRHALSQLQGSQVFR
jgi:hypothetical protein